MVENEGSAVPGADALAGQKRLEARVEDGKAELRFYDEDGKMVASQTAGLEGLTKLIWGLAAVRSALVNGQSEPIEMGNPVPLIAGPAWFTEPNFHIGGSSLYFNLPGFGPLGVALTADHVGHIAGLLIQQLAVLHNFAIHGTLKAGEPTDNE